MNKLSRWQFISSCLYFVLSGFSSVFFSLFAGCKKIENSGKHNYEQKTHNRFEGKAMINSDFEPAYLKLHKSGELKKRGITIEQEISFSK